MEALISGALGTATLIDGDVAEVIWLDGRRKSMRPAIARSMYRNVDDTVHMEPCTKTHAIESLRLHWMKDRALVLTLILLDVTTPPDERTEIQKYLDEWVTDDNVADYLKCVMYSRPLPDQEIVMECDIDIESPIGKLLKNVFESQTEIRRIRASWDGVASKLTENCRTIYEQRLVAMGTFYRLVSPSKKEIDSLRFECLENLSDLPNFRDVVGDFVDPFADLIAAVPESTNPQVAIDFPRNEIDYEAPTQAAGSSRDYYQHVQHRMTIADSFFRSGEIDKAVKVVYWLIDEQGQRGDNEYAAKTLCSASEMAKRANRFDLQLDFALEANKLEPADDRVFGHIGDAYLNLDQLHDARQWFTRAADGKNREFGLGGLVRVLRRENRLEEAYEYVLKLLEIPDAGLEAWLQKAEILRSLARYEEAINAYTDTVKRFPNSHVPLCGMAATYADAGLYEQAMSTYDNTISRFESSSVAHTAKGHLLARLGFLSGALPYLHRGIEFAEDKTVGVSALASALRINGKNGQAIKLLEKEVQMHPNSEEMWTGLVASARECGRYADAEMWVSRARDCLGSTPSIIMQQARIAAARGSYSNALELVNSVLDGSSRNQEAVVEKSRLLRRLDRLTEAQNEVQSLLDSYASSDTVKTEATVLGLVEISEDVVAKRAGTRDYATQEDWNYDHACSVVLIKRKEARGAWRISLDGKKRSPFRSQRKRFGLVFAIARDMLGQIGSVVNALKGYVGPEAAIMRAVAYWKLGLSDRLERTLTTIRRTHGPSSSSDSNKLALVNLVSSPYKGERDDQKVIEFERHILLQAA